VSASFERVVIIGSSCAGKTTFAVRLAEALGQPTTDLDELFWAPNWQPKPLEEFRRLAEQAASSERWVVAGNYSDVRAVLWPRATAVVWLNYGFAVVLWRAVTRTVRRVVTRELLWQGNRESFKRSFLSRESILVWVVSTFYKRRRQFQALRENNPYPHLSWVELNHPAEAERFVRSLNEASNPSIERTAAGKPAAAAHVER
jgi:adenylate kinase family enzyme